MEKSRVSSIPGSLRTEDAGKLSELVNGKNVLQFGCYCGRALVVLARSAWATWVLEDFLRPEGRDGAVGELRANADRYFPEDAEVNLIYSPTPDTWVFPDGSRDLPEGGVDVVYRDADRWEDMREQDDLLAHELLARGGVYVWHDEERKLRWLQIEPTPAEVD